MEEQPKWKSDQNGIHPEWEKKKKTEDGQLV